MATLRRFLNDAAGATAIEYCLIAGFISIAIVIGVTAIGTRLASNYFNPINAHLN